MKRNFELKDYIQDSDIHKDRIFHLKEFIKGKKKVIDVGCGAFMPQLLGIKYACDKYNAKPFLDKLDWKGEFKKANVYKLPYKDKEFDLAICSEVIEHLNSKRKVTKAIRELNRIAKEWIITTPCAYDTDPNHKFHFGYGKDNLFEVIPEEFKFNEDYIVIRKGYYYYISNNIPKMLKIFKVKNGNK